MESVDLADRVATGIEVSSAPAAADSTDAIAILLRERSGLARSDEMVTVGIPLPRGLAKPDQRWMSTAGSTMGQLCQTRPLALWPDGSVKWMLTTVPASCAGHGSRRLELNKLTTAKPAETASASVSRFPDWFEIHTSRATFSLPNRGNVLLFRASVGGHNILGEPGLFAELIDQQGRKHRVQVQSVEIVENGPLRVQVAFRGRLARLGLNCCGVWTFHANSGVVRLELTLHNPSRARHSNGCWDLGDPGSVRFREFALCGAPAGIGELKATWSEDGVSQWTQHSNGVQIYQDSSGGEAYDSRNHITAAGKIPVSFRGYRVRFSGSERFGLRAQPIVALQRGEHWLAATVAEFWQQFPKAIAAGDEGVRIGLFPGEHAELHELQGGEQKTHRIAISFGASDQPDPGGLAAFHDPLEAICDSGWMRSAGAIPNLPPSPRTLRKEWQATASHSLDGESSFFAKREVIDEYGWRNYGDLWADHEDAYYKGPRPVISHYNNQYDGLQGFLLSYLVTHDRRWWELADPLARHIIDIDIYHTEQDRAVYNGGLFWHTSHYVDAFASSHRTYAKAAHPSGGGGLSNEHNYTSGLLLYYYLTGNEQAKVAVESLAQWVIGMDDGRRHVLGIVQDGPTGFASRTTVADYHRPGRGAGNSINALLDGWLATGRRDFIAKAQELIERTVHPHDDVQLLDLGNAELRWSYTVYLQVMIRILSASDEFGFSQELLTYIRESVLTYARWMAQHEHFYLDQPQKLEYPTETWAAQELRKANVLVGAALYAPRAEADAFRQKADWIYQRAWSTLMSMPTRTYTRPTILALQLGLVEAASKGQVSVSNMGPHETAPIKSPPRSFLPQKSAFRQTIRSPIGLATASIKLLRFWRWHQPLRGTWLAQRLRTWRQRCLP